MSIVLIDNDGRKGATAILLSMAAQRELKTAPEVYTIAKFRRAISTINLADSYIFVTVPEANLSTRPNGPDTPRIMCESLQIAQSAVLQNLNCKVILVAQPGTSRITGIDAVAALLAGMAGIVDDRLFLTEGVLKSLYRHEHVDRRWRTMLAVGEVAGRLRNIQEMFDAWDEDPESNTTQYARCFKTCLALAQLDRLRPLSGRGHKYKFTQLALALNVASSETSFRLFDGDLRKVLSIIANQLIDDEDKSERLRLPTYVKEKLEFPSNLPVIGGVCEENIYQILYDACHEMHISHRDSTGNHPVCAIRLPVKSFRHLDADRRS